MSKISAGIFFYSQPTKRFLYLLRNDKQSFSWSIPGGKLEENETLLEGLKRECDEEIQYWPDNAKLIPIQKFSNQTFTYHTFFCSVDKEFIPKLNNEHVGYDWIDENNHPKPLHPGLFSTINIDVVQEKLKFLLGK
jgi:8-oxo-dGTP pyrophosphatase MutT (NUDIX family)